MPGEDFSGYFCMQNNLEENWFTGQWMCGIIRGKIGFENSFKNK